MRNSKDAARESTREKYIRRGIITPTDTPFKEVRCYRCDSTFQVLADRPDRSCGPCRNRFPMNNRPYSTERTQT
jgi:hypothetical protein